MDSEIAAIVMDENKETSDNGEGQNGAQQIMDEEPRLLSRETVDSQRRIIVEKLNTLTQDLKSLMSSDVESERVRVDYKCWLNCYEEFQLVHSDFFKLLNEQELHEYLESEYKIFDERVCSFRQLVEEWFQQHRDVYVTPNDSVSRTSRRSSHRSNTSKMSNLSAVRIKQEQENVELIERRRLLEKKQKLEMEKLEMKLREEQENHERKLRQEKENLEIKLREEQMEMDFKMAVADAKTRVLNQEYRTVSEASCSTNRSNSNGNQKACPENRPAETEGYNSNFVESSSVNREHMNPSNDIYCNRVYLHVPHLPIVKYMCLHKIKRMN
ncbi:trichohyalin isoform X2 [Patella vulgata]|uniref:trichohyalin isoform X2 n=1 Tax=Patella vulgata TaxID=6465 RepID=UPI00217FF559|nr:trichohyalin isoform X2 [Patella vulgata]